MIDRKKRVERMLPLLEEDLKVNLPWFYSVGALGKQFSKAVPSPSVLVGKILEMGSNASLTHFSGQALRTNLPLELDGFKLL